MEEVQEIKSKLSFSYIDVLLIITALIWGSNPSIVKLGIREMDPFAYNIGRYIVATVSCWIFLLIKEKDWKLEKQDIFPILCIGLIGNFINQICFIIGVSNTTAGNTSLINAALPMIVAGISGLLKVEKIHVNTLIGIFISFFGIIFIVAGTGQRISMTDQYFFGNMVIFGGVISWATYTIFNRKYFIKYSPLKITAYGLLVGLIGMTVVWNQSFLAQDWTIVPVKNYMSILYSGLFSITLGTVFWNMGIKKVGGTKTSLYNNISPVVSIFLGIMLLGEVFRMMQGIGALFIFLGLAFTKMKAKIELIPRRVAMSKKS